MASEIKSIRSIVPPQGPTSIILRHSLQKKTPQTPVELVDEFLDYGQKERTYSEATVRRYRGVTEQFLNFIGELDVTHVRAQDIRAYFAWMLERGASDSTLRQTLSCLRSLYRYFEMCEIVAVSPARVVQTRKAKRRLPKPLSEEIVNKLIDSATNIRDKALIEFAYSTGCRAAEIAGVKIENVDWTSRTVSVVGKGDKERLVPLGSKAIGALRSYLDRRTRGYLFQSEGRPDQHGHLVRVDRSWVARWHEDYAFDSTGRLVRRMATRVVGKISEMTREEARAKLARIVDKLPPRPRPTKDLPLTTRAIYGIVKSVALRAGITRVHPHRFRHSFGTHLHEHGADILSISRLMGHASIATTSIYTEVSQKHMRETLERCHPHWSRK